MEILFYRYNSICEPDIIQVFTDFGITVHTEEAEMTDKSITPKQCALLITKWLTEHPIAFVFSINFYPAISYTCNRFKVPYVCWSVDSPVPELFSNALKNEWNRIFLFDRAQYDFFRPVNPQRIFYLPLATNAGRWENVILSMTDEDYARYGADVSFVGSLYTEKCRLDRLPRVARHIPAQAAAPDWTDEAASASARQGERMLSARTQGFVDGLIEAQLKVYGYNFIYDSLTDPIVREIADADPDFYRGGDTYTDTDRYLVAHQYIGMKLASVERLRTLLHLAEHFQVALYTRSNPSILGQVGLDVRGGADTLTEMPKIFHASRINLNMTMRPIETGLSLRVWDVLGCGGFLITNYQSEIPEYFEIGRDLETYGSASELDEKIQYYLTHEDERVEIAINGYEKTVRHHTYEKRISQMIQVLDGLTQ